MQTLQHPCLTCWYLFSAPLLLHSVPYCVGHLPQDLAHNPIGMWYWAIWVNQLNVKGDWDDLIIWILAQWIHFVTLKKAWSTSQDGFLNSILLVQTRLNDFQPFRNIVAWDNQLALVYACKYHCRTLFSTYKKTLDYLYQFHFQKTISFSGVCCCHHVNHLWFVALLKDQPWEMRYPYKTH